MNKTTIKEIIEEYKDISIDDAISVYGAMGVIREGGDLEKIFKEIGFENIESVRDIIAKAKNMITKERV